MAKTIMLHAVPRMHGELSIHGVNSIIWTARQAGVMALKTDVILDRPPQPPREDPPEIITITDAVDESAEVSAPERALEDVMVHALGEASVESAVLLAV